jgi:hypothetical protein
MLNNLDWQVIGTWFTGLAMASFAGLTWWLLKRQQQLLYNPKLIVYSHYDSPKVGKEVFKRKVNKTTLYYDGICWEVVLTNPGVVPIPIIDTTARIISITTGENLLIWSGQYCKVLTGKNMNAKSRVTIAANKTLIRKFIISDPNFESTINQWRERRNIRLEVKFVWKADKLPNENVINSADFEIPADIPFSERSDADRTY